MSARASACGKTKQRTRAGNAHRLRKEPKGAAGKRGRTGTAPRCGRDRPGGWRDKPGNRAPHPRRSEARQRVDCLSRLRPGRATGKKGMAGISRDFVDRGSVRPRPAYIGILPALSRLGAREEGPPSRSWPSRALARAGRLGNRGACRTSLSHAPARPGLSNARCRCARLQRKPAGRRGRSRSGSRGGWTSWRSSGF